MTLEFVRLQGISKILIITRDKIALKTGSIWLVPTLCDPKVHITSLYLKLYGFPRALSQKFNTLTPSSFPTSFSRYKTSNSSSKPFNTFLKVKHCTPLSKNTVFCWFYFFPSSLGFFSCMYTLLPKILMMSSLYI